jgi:hypothetical protein
MIFTHERRQEVQERLKQESENGKVAAPAIAKALGEVWKGMREEEKDVYRQKSKERAEAAAAGKESAAGSIAHMQSWDPGGRSQLENRQPCVYVPCASQQLILMKKNTLLSIICQLQSGYGVIAHVCPWQRKYCSHCSGCVRAAANSVTLALRTCTCLCGYEPNTSIIR